MLMNEDKTMCSILEGLFETLSSKFRPQFNEMRKSLQFQKLYRKDGENAEEWRGEAVTHSSRVQLPRAR